MTLDRRRALQVMVGGAALAAGPARAVTPRPDDRDVVGLLFDATVCIGCKACVTACTQANGLEPNTRGSEGRWQMPTDLDAQTMNIIKLYQGEAPDDHAYIKRQCMHCLDPACVAGCPFGALYKRPEDGVVAWRGDRCVGCRYCEVACPFQVPKFDWARFNPAIVKCELCLHRLDDGLPPACTEACPTGAVLFGPRADLLREAKGRIATHPGRYFEDRVYGEHEVGGTQALYLSGVAFSKLGLPTLTSASLAAYGTKVHSVLYRWLALPAALWAGMTLLVRKRLNASPDGDGTITGLPGAP